MKLIIEISEEDYNNINLFLNGETVKGGIDIFKAFEIIKNGIPHEQKAGHWKIVPDNSKHGEYRPNKYACSECGWEIDLCRGLQQDTGHRLFCEHCGAKMESENARGDKE